MCCLYVFCTGFFCHFEAAGWVYDLKKCCSSHKIIKGSTIDRFEIRSVTPQIALFSPRNFLNPKKNQ